MRKIIVLLLTLLLSSTVLPLNIVYEEISEDVSMIINDEKVSNEVFKAQTDIIKILSTIKNTNETFFQTLTNTATGLDFLNTYNKQVALNFSGNILFIQFVEKNGINLERESLRKNIANQFDQIIKDSELTEEDLNLYLNSKGFSSKESYLDLQYYNALYERAINLYYQSKSSEYAISSEEIQNEYKENKEAYVRPPQSEISIIAFKDSEEASLVYNKITEGYYSFEEIYEEKKKEEKANNITIDLNVTENEYINIVKSNTPGYISKPQKISENEWILIKILSKTPEKSLSIDEAKDKIIFNLKDKKTKEYFDKILPEEFKNFKENSKIVFNKKLFY